MKPRVEIKQTAICEPPGYNSNPDRPCIIVVDGIEFTSHVTRDQPLGAINTAAERLVEEMNKR